MCVYGGGGVVICRGGLASISVHARMCVCVGMYGGVEICRLTHSNTHTDTLTHTHSLTHTRTRTRTTSMPLQEEKKILKEIDELKKSKKVRTAPHRVRLCLHVRMC